MRRLEPAEAIWLCVLPAMLTTSAVLIDHGHEPLTNVARKHPLLTAYIGAHLLGLLPPFLDAISIGHGGYLRWRSRTRVAAAAAAGAAGAVLVAGS